jgi:hypothetical protein
MPAHLPRETPEFTAGKRSLVLLRLLACRPAPDPGETGVGAADSGPGAAEPCGDGEPGPDDTVYTPTFMLWSEDGEIPGGGGGGAECASDATRCGNASDVLEGGFEL